MEIPTASTLQSRINTFDEQDVSIPSNDLFRPPLKQLGDSLNETKEHYASSNDLSVVPSNFPLTNIKDHIVKLIRDNEGFRDYDFLIERKLKPVKEGEREHKGFVFLATFLSVALDFPSRGRPDDVICDVFILLPKQPALVLTIVRSTSETDELSIYNTSVARGVCMSLGRFMDEGFKTAFGIVKDQDLRDGNLFKSRFEDIIRTSAKYVTYSSLSMNKMKYDKVLTAFWASISETKLVVTSQSDDKCLRFLTKDQCIVLIENINRKEVEVSSKPGTGSTLLLAEAARRLSHLGNTLFVCEKREDCEKYRNMRPEVTTCNSEDFKGPAGIDPGDYTCVVDETPKERRYAWRRESLNGILWVHRSLPDRDEDTSNTFEKRHCDIEYCEENAPNTKRRRVSDEMTNLSLDPKDTKEGDTNVSSKKERTHGVESEDVLQETENEISESDESSPSFTAIADGKEVTVMCSSMKFDRERVNTKHCFISDNHELVNCPETSGGKKTYKRYWGTSSTDHIPVNSATTSLVSQYWEAHAEIEPKDLEKDSAEKPEERSDGERTWGPVLEFGVVEESHADKRVWMSQHKRFWCLSLEGCKAHFPCFCARVRKEVKMGEEVSCHPEEIASTGKTSLKYGVVVDVAQDMVAFIDVDKETVLGTVRADFRETLVPMFGVKHIAKNKLNIKIKLVSGTDIDITERKKLMINECYQMLANAK